MWNLHVDAQTLAKKLPEQKIEFLSFSSLPKLLSLSGPPLMRDGFSQLKYIERFLKNATTPCRSVIIERYYIDRDFIDDFSAFYSTSLYAYPNWCQRIHFFSIDKEKVRQGIRALVRLGAASGVADGGAVFRSACKDFSNDAYLGFSVIKPLQGSPVGRTVLRHYEEEAGNGLLRKFNCTRHYGVHLLGVELTVCGLVFQQQDVGVSACATTALWSSLSKTADFEDISTPTPAQITRLGSQFLLASGRSMPSEGLSLEQMCQAVQSVQVSSNLIKVENLNDGRGYLHSAISSGFAPVLILESLLVKGSWHAVTAAGMKLRAEHKPTMIGNRIDDEASDVVSLYVHDDRHSPYFRVDLPKTGKKRLVLRFNLENDMGEIFHTEKWRLSHLLIPIHGKVRLSFAALRDLAVEVITMIIARGETYARLIGAVNVSNIQFKTLILRAPKYVEHLFYGKQKIQQSQRTLFNKKILLPRYVGIARLTASYIGILDVLFDTTSTLKNPHCLGVIARIPNDTFAWTLAHILAIELKCPLILEVKS